MNRLTLISKALSTAIIAVVFVSAAHSAPTYVNSEPSVFCLSEATLFTDIQAIASSDEATWTLLQVTPDRFSGMTVHSSPNDYGENIVSGKYKVLDCFAAPVANQEGEYSWNGSHDIYTKAGWLLGIRQFPFKYTGLFRQCVAVCEYKVTSSGEPYFVNSSFVPDDWKSYLRPAVSYLRSHRDLLEASADKAIMAQWTPLLRSDNPYLALTACRMLASAGVLLPEDLDVLVNSQDIKLGSAALGAAALYGWLNNKENQKWMLDRATHSQNVRQLAVLSLSAYHAAYISRECPRLNAYVRPEGEVDENSHDFRRLLFTTVNTRLKEISPVDQPDDEAWSAANYICRSF
ncbi:MAG TPA: hypothetical protein VGK19_10190 [Capsulimonadaceae bacterium]|jgi:hypothetical protein